MKDRIEARGGHVVFVGNGAPAMAQAFREDFRVEAPVFTDPTLRVFALAGLRRGFGSVWKTAKHAVRALRGGFVQGRTQGDALQQGGVLVVGTDGEPRYAFASAEAGDHPDLEEVIAALP